MPSEVKIVLTVDAQNASAVLADVVKGSEAAGRSIGVNVSGGSDQATASVENLTKKMADWYKSGQRIHAVDGAAAYSNNRVRRNDAARRRIGEISR